MKRIYLLMILFVAAIGNVNAQRNCDLELFQAIGPNQTINIKGSNPSTYAFLYRFKNNGPDTVSHTDTLKFRTPYGSFNLTLGNTGGIGVGDTVIWRDTVTLTPPTPAPPASYDNPNFQWCDSVWIKPVTGTVTDPQPNNRKCTTVRAILWRTSINDLDANDNGLAIYPNPANSTVNITHNFKGNSAGSLIITDVTGKQLYKEEIKNGLSGEHTFKVNVSGFASGMHFVQIVTEDVKVISKMTIQN